MVQPGLEFEAHSNYVLSVLSPEDHSELITAGMDRLICHWKLPETAGSEPPELLNEITAHSNSVNSLAFTPDRKYLLSASTDATVRIWSWPDLELVQTLTGHKKTVLD